MDLCKSSQAIGALRGTLSVNLAPSVCIAVSNQSVRLHLLPPCPPPPPPLSLSLCLSACCLSCFCFPMSVSDVLDHIYYVLCLASRVKPNPTVSFSVVFLPSPPPPLLYLSVCSPPPHPRPAPFTVCLLAVCPLFLLLSVP